MGVGNGFDEELLERLADHGNGNFYYIERADDIPDIFARELEGLCSVVAQNVQLTLTPQESVTLTGIFGYKPTELDGKTYIRSSSRNNPPIQSKYNVSNNGK